MNTISIIIPTHNRPSELTSCLDSLETILNREDIKFLIVLDGCKTESWNIVNSYRCKNIVTIEGDGNLYWGGAIALGMQIAFEEYHSDAVIWLNDDAEVNADNVCALLDAHKVVPTSIIGCCLRAKNLNGLSIYELKESQINNLYKVSHLNGNCTLIPKFVYNKIGNINCKKFPHFADAPYIEKAKQAGFNCLVVKDNWVDIHYDIIRHLPICLQMLAFRGNLYHFFYSQLFSIKSKWYIPYRISYTINKYNLIGAIYFPMIFTRDFFPALLLLPLTFLSCSIKSKIIVLVSTSVLKLSEEEITELVLELNP